MNINIHKKNEKEQEEEELVCKNEYIVPTNQIRRIYNST